MFRIGRNKTSTVIQFRRYTREERIMITDCVYCGGVFDDAETNFCFWCRKKQKEESVFDYIDPDYDLEHNITIKSNRS